ncbi:NAD(P)-dependent oxidoreductase [Pelagibacteraceae bacterium]|nr:NAD(P)-dependent oxidoreductase [Pelagibacteraceae bacterium]
MSKKILITGSNGFISKKLKNYLIKKNYNVFATTRVKNNELYFDLKNELSAVYTIPKFDILIHLSYIRKKSFKEEQGYNINGTKNIFLLAKKYNAKIVYISSQSANKNSYSNYGKIKYEIEKMALQFNATIIRPGLIYDKNSRNGLYGNIEKLIKYMPFLIVPNGLNKKINLCNIEKFNDSINNILNNTNYTLKINLYEKENYK